MAAPNAIRALFLRFYGANLARRRRNDPASACNDAITQLSAVGGTLSAALFALLSLVIYKPFLKHMYALDRTFILIVISASFGLTYWFRREFRAYAQTPEAATPYRDPARVRSTNVIYFVVPLALIVLIGLLLQVADPTQ